MQQKRRLYTTGSILALLILAGIIIAAITIRTPGAASADQTSTGIFAPYIDTSLYSTQVTSLADMVQQTGSKNYTLAFVLNGGGTCNAEWNGVVGLNQAEDPTQKSISVNISTNIEKLRASGGNVIISFGGQNGQELAQSCTSVASLEQAYQSVIAKYQVTQIDFDIEGSAVADQASIDLRNQALAALQTQDKNLLIDYTLPVLPTGLIQTGLNIIQSAIKYKVNIHIVNGMAMNYGSSPDPNPAPGAMGQMAEQVGQSLHDQMKTLYSGKTDTQLWSMVGITPMIGVNNTQDETFTTQDASMLEGWAAQHNIGLLSFWSLGRDIACSGGATDWASPTCSSISQQPFAFAKIFNQFAGGTIPASSGTVTSIITSNLIVNPDVTPTPTVATTVKNTQTGGIKPWVGNNTNPTLYNPGDEVTYQGHTYKCLRQIWGETQWAPNAQGILGDFWQQIS